MHELVIRTPRLDLVAATLSHVDAELEGHAALGLVLGAAVPPDWPPGEYDRPAQEFFRRELLASGSSRVGWLTWYALTRDADGGRADLIAGAGFFGPAADGRVEIGYSVVPAARGCGHATDGGQGPRLPCIRAPGRRRGRRPHVRRERRVDPGAPPLRLSSGWSRARPRIGGVPRDAGLARLTTRSRASAAIRGRATAPRDTRRGRRNPSTESPRDPA